MLRISGAQTRLDAARCGWDFEANDGADVPPPRRVDARNTLSGGFFAAGALSGLAGRFFAKTGFLTTSDLRRQHVVLSLAIRASYSSGAKFAALISLQTNKKKVNVYFSYQNKDYILKKTYLICFSIKFITAQCCARKLNRICGEQLKHSQLSCLSISVIIDREKFCVIHFLQNTYGHLLQQ